MGGAPHGRRAPRRAVADVTSIARRSCPPPLRPRRRRAESDEETLVARLASRDEDALRELHRRYAPLVFAIAARVVGAETAEEMVQDVFVTLWRKHEQFDPARGAFKPWVAQVTRRRALNGLRRAKGEAIADDGAIDAIEDLAPPPDEAEWIAHRRAAVRAAVDALPEAQRKALSLAFFDELTHEQIAAALGTPLGTTKTRIRAALKRLAPVLVAVLATVAIAIAWRHREERAAQSEEALRMVTASDVVPLRLGPSPEAPPEAHGNWRTRPGARVAVLTTSHLPPLASGDSSTSRGRTTRADGSDSASSRIAEDGRSLLVVDRASDAPAIEELRVTREHGEPVDAPRGDTMIAWP